MRATTLVVAVFAVVGASAAARAEERFSSLDPMPNAKISTLDASAFTESFEIAQLYAAEAVERAEQDFDARRDELGLIGSAPMVGLGPERTEAVPQNRDRAAKQKHVKSRNGKTAQ
jgi:hypothetical protein